MKQNLKFAVLLLTVFVAVFTFCYLYNLSTPQLTNHSSVPKDINTRNYVLTGVHVDQDGCIRVQLTNAPDCPLALSMNDMGRFVLSTSLQLNGTEIYSYSSTAAFRRVNVVELDPALWADSGVIELVIHADGWSQRSQELISGAPNSAPFLIFGTLENAMAASNSSFFVMSVLFGLYLLMILNSLTLLFCRPFETSFLFFAFVCLVRLANTAIDAALPFAQLSMSTYYTLRPMLVALPVLANTSVGIFLLRPAERGRTRFVIVTLLLTVCAVLLQYLTSRNWYHVYQLCAFVVFLYYAYRAAHRRQKGWAILTAGYTAGIAVVAFVYAINILNLSPGGEAIVFLNLTNFSYAPSLLACMAHINLTLMGKFRESERLAGALAATNAVLDQRVEERTRELTEAQERKRNMMLNIFHDLRNPVFVLRGCLQHIHAADESEQRYRRTMEERLDLLGRLIEDLFLAENWNLTGSASIPTTFF